MKILVTGGAGYIGSCVVKYLIDNNYEVIVVDNLSHGFVDAIDKKAKFYYQDYGNLNVIMKQEKPEAVIHLGAVASVPESFEQTDEYYQTNVVQMKNLLEACGRNGVKYFIFSSSAAVYGNYLDRPYNEKDETHPINPYGNTKLIGEIMLKDYAQKYDMKYIIFRYFCAAGADLQHNIGERHIPETHVIPVLIKKALNHQCFSLYGDDYDTIDGTCIRDFVHIKDIANAHLLGLEYLQKDNPSTIFNLGGMTSSIKNLLTCVFIKIAPVEFKVENRRYGDPAYLVADITRAKNILKWEPKNSTIDIILHDAFSWESKLK